MDSTFFIYLNISPPVYYSVFLTYQFLINFESVEAQSIDTDNSTLADKCRRVYFINQSENLLRLTLTCQHKEHVYVLATIASMTIHHRTSSVSSRINGCTQFQILF